MRAEESLTKSDTYCMVARLRQLIRSRYFGYAVIAAWAFPTAIALSLMLGLHSAPQIKDNLVGISQSGGLVAHHFLSLKCTCSVNLVRHLLERGASSQAREVIHLIHAQPDAVAKLKLAGFEVVPIGEEEAVVQFHLQSLPQLLVKREDRILYQGGYGRDQQHVQIYDDIEIIKTAAMDQTTPELPIFGCSNGKLRKNSLDILGVKYGFNQ